MSVQVKPTAAPAAPAKPAAGNNSQTDAAGGFAALFDALRAAADPAAASSEVLATDGVKRRVGTVEDEASTDPALNAYAASVAAATLAAPSTTPVPTSDAARTPGASDIPAARETSLLGTAPAAATNQTMDEAAQALATAADDPATTAFARQVQDALAAQRQAANGSDQIPSASDRNSLPSSATTTPPATALPNTDAIPNQTVTETTVARSARPNQAAARNLDRRDALTATDENSGANPLAATPAKTGADAAIAAPGTPPAQGLALPSTAALDPAVSTPSSTPPGPPVNLQNPNWTGDLGQRIDWMQHQGLSRADIQVNPEHLGPIRIQIDLRHDSATVSLSAQHAGTRELLNQGLAQLQAALQPTAIGTLTTQVVQPDLLLNGNPFANQDFQRSESSQDRNDAPRRGSRGIAGRGAASSLDETTNRALTQRGTGLLDTFA